MQNPAKSIIAAIGVEKFMNELGFTKRNINHARASGKFAGHWFDEIEKLCHENGIHCPRHAFNWKRPDHKVGSGSDILQGVAGQSAQKNGQYIPQGKENLTSEAGA